MKINSKVLSIPPFISIAWKSVTSIHMENLNHNPILVILTTNGARIELPALDLVMIETIFAAHAQYAEELASKNTSQGRKNFPQIHIGSFNLDSFNNPFQHNPEQIDAPNLPREIVDKILTLSDEMGIDNHNLFPTPEENCNCLHCQIARTFREEKDKEQTPEEAVTEEDLRFRLWDISPASDTLYLVTNPLDAQENYHVCLGDPVGCTCGQKNCEHIRAVLNS
jgi:hypothetical protein